MNDEFSARKVTTDVVTALERRRAEIVADPGQAVAAVEGALTEIGRSYAESQLPPTYFAALAAEIRQIVPHRWQAAAQPFTALESRGFGSWRGGDVYARLAYVFLGLLVGGLCVWAPFIPIWEKWFPFALGVLSWWLPDAQAAWHRRHYARRLGNIVGDLASCQTAIEAHVSLGELLPPGSDP